MPGPAALLPVLGWVWRQLRVPGLRSTALVLAVIVAARIGLDPQAAAAAASLVVATSAAAAASGTSDVVSDVLSGAVGRAVTR